MRKTGIGLLAAVVLWAGAAATGFGWEKGTHAFIAHLLRKSGGPLNIEEMYGAMAPDAFNYLFSDPGQAYRVWIYGQTHFEFMKAMDAVKFGYEKAAAYGFATHNNAWGADMTAHTKSLTLDPTEGYIITKAKLLHSYLMSDPGYAALLGDAPEVALEICHNLVEAAGDVILKRYDPTIGEKLMEIASRPKPNAQNLMVRAYAWDLKQFSQSTPFPLSLDQAKSLIIEVENEFRMGAIGYGYLLQGEEAVLISNIIDQFKALAGAFLAAYGLPVPDDPTLLTLIGGGLDLSLQLCQADYMTEVLATVNFVQAELKKHGLK